MATWSIAALRTILATETDADSPGSEELLGQIRENIEALIMLVFDTGVSGTVVSCTETVLTDTANFAGADVHNGQTLLITSGTAIGNMYTIDDSDANTLTCTGDTLTTDGVAAGGGDTYKILYDMKVNTDGHNHDGINSVELPYLSGWIQMDGSGTIAINDSFNVSSISDGGVGLYTINWDTDFANTDYAYTTSARFMTNAVIINTQAGGPAAASISVQATDDAGGAEDPHDLCVMAIGQQV